MGPKTSAKDSVNSCAVKLGPLSQAATFDTWWNANTFLIIIKQINTFISIMLFQRRRFGLGCHSLFQVSPCREFCGPWMSEWSDGQEAGSGHSSSSWKIGPVEMTNPAGVVYRLMLSNCEQSYIGKMDVRAAYSSGSMQPMPRSEDLTCPLLMSILFLNNMLSILTVLK